MRAVTVAIAALLGLAGCTGGTDPAAGPSASSAPVAFDQRLHAELLAMLARDQSGRTGGPDTEGDQARTERLKQIVAEHGWPTIPLVGADGEDAAWAIVQHADADPRFQQEVLPLLRAAVARGQASPGNLAYLEDRVAVAQGRPQRYGTQMACGPTGPQPRTPIADEAGVERRRAAAGLPALAAYLKEMAAVCARD